MTVVRSSPLRTGRLYSQEFTWYSILEAESTPGNMVPTVASEKNPQTTPLGIDPETLLLVAQCLKHYATPGDYKVLHLKILLSPGFNKLTTGSGKGLLWTR
jgi:hypothetical protein